MKTYLAASIPVAVLLLFLTIPERQILEQENAQQNLFNMIGLIAAYHDSIGKNADSLRLESCRGGTITANGSCSGRKLAPRVSKIYTWSMNIRHHKYRADSVMNQFMVKLVPPALGYTSRILATVTEGDADSTFCALITRSDGREFVGWWPIWRRPIGDSAWFRPRDGGFTMAQKCGKAFMEAGLTMPTDSIQIEWNGMWVDGDSRSWRPFASVRQP